MRPLAGRGGERQAPGETFSHFSALASSAPLGRPRASRPPPGRSSHTPPHFNLPSPPTFLARILWTKETLHAPLAAAPTPLVQHGGSAPGGRQQRVCLVLLEFGPTRRRGEGLRHPPRPLPAPPGSPLGRRRGRAVRARLPLSSQPLSWEGRYTHPHTHPHTRAHTHPHTHLHPRKHTGRVVSTPQPLRWKGHDPIHVENENDCFPGRHGYGSVRVCFQAAAPQRG